MRPIAWLLVVLALVAAACGRAIAPSATDDGSGFVACESDAACPAGERCLGGVCGQASAPSPAGVTVLDLQEVPATAQHPASGSAVELDGVVAASATVSYAGGTALFVEDAPASAGGSAGRFEGILVVLAAPASLAPGDLLTVRGTYDAGANGGEVDAATVTKTGHAPAPAPATVSLDACDTPSGALAWNGSLVTVSSGEVGAISSDGFPLDGSNGDLTVSFALLGSGRPSLQPGDTLESATGLLVLASAGPTLLPRTTSDLVVGASASSGSGSTGSTGTSGSTSTGGGRAPQPGEVVINEVLADPPSSTTDPTVGDANGDGHRDGLEDEFVELVNRTRQTLDLSGVLLRTLNKRLRPPALVTRATLASGTALAPHQALVVFGGGNPAGAFGGSLVLALAPPCSSDGCLALSNSGTTVEVDGADGTVLDALTYDSTLGAHNESMNRDPDVSGTTFVLHKSLNSRLAYSPGTEASGAEF